MPRDGTGVLERLKREVVRLVSQFHSKVPVPFTDDQGNPVLDINNKPMMRPSDVSPNFFVDVGSTAGAVDDGATAIAGLQLFGRGGPLDVQRVGPDRVYVDAFRDFANVAIGLYAGAAGIPQSTTYFIANRVAASSVFARGTVFDRVYTHLPAPNAYDMRLGYQLVASRRIGPSASR